MSYRLDDSVEVCANASSYANADYRRIAAEILKDAERMTVRKHRRTPSANSRFCLRLEASEIVTRSSGRNGWLHAVRHQLDADRESERWAVPRSRIDRLLEAERRIGAGGEN